MIALAKIILTSAVIFTMLGLIAVCVYHVQSKGAPPDGGCV